jgi:small-conductance mechanosensitive channel
VAIVSPTLSVFEFGAAVGTPLVCEVAAGAVGPYLTNPQLSAILSQIVSACQNASNQGTVTLKQIDQRLSALAAINPTVRPLLDQLAASLQQASNSQVPFAGSLAELAALVKFFEG